MNGRSHQFENARNIFEKRAKQNVIIKSLGSFVTDKVNYLNVIKSLKEEEKKPKTLLKLKPTLLDKDKKNVKKVLPFKSFCKGFFICSLSNDKGKIMKDSQAYRSMCGHLTCSKLPAMEPEIISRYPLQDTEELEINADLASICFPSGIKVCYGQDRRATYKNFFSPITTLKGDRLYMMTYHFYVKYTAREYNVSFQQNSFYHYWVQLNEEISTNNKDEKSKESDCEYIAELKSREQIYVPFCIALISEIPYMHQMEKCLDQIYNVLISKPNDNNKNYINELIVFLTKSIPIPSEKIMLSFQFPLNDNKLKDEMKKTGYMKLEQHNESIILYDKLHPKTTYRNLSQILECLSIPNIIMIYNLLFLEEKILFVDKDYHRQCNTVDNFLSLLYPFEWLNPYISIMSGNITECLQAPLPFCIGINEDLFNTNAKALLEETSNNVFVAYIQRDMICNLDNQNILDERLTFPLEVSNKLKIELNSIKLLIESCPKEQKEENIYWINLYIQYLFLECFAMLFHDITEYLQIKSKDNDVDIDKKTDNIKRMLSKKNSNEIEFYSAVTSTQLFQYFLQKFSKHQSEFVLFLSVLIEINSKKDNNKSLVRDIKTMEKVKNAIITSNFYSVLNMNTKINLSLLINMNKEDNRNEITHFNTTNKTTDFIQKIDDKLYPDENKIHKYLIPNIS